jgi:uncharacterized protein (TIGR00297 family)
MDPVLERLLWAVGLNLGLGTLAFALGLVNRAGYLGGMLVGILTYMGTGWQGYIVLWLFFAVGTAVSKFGHAKKASWGGAQEEKGRRGAKHALANCAVGVLLSLGAYVFEQNGMLFWCMLMRAGMVGAFATALSDTTSNELGQLYGKHPFLPTNFKAVPVGTEGAISVEGTLIGILASGLMAGLGFFLPGLIKGGTLDFGPWQIAPAVVIGAFVGSMLESYIGATLGQKNIIGNEAMNFTNTLVGAAVTMGVFYLLAA